MDKPYVVHYISLTTPPHIIAVDVVSDNMISVVGRVCKERNIRLDQIVAINEKPFLTRVVGYIQARLGGTNNVRIYPTGSIQYGSEASDD